MSAALSSFQIGRLTILDSINDIGWYGSAYLLTSCFFQLLYGRIYKFFPVKYVMLVAIVLFEIGSAVCGAAPSSNVLILGRAIAGIGSAGIMSGTMQTLVHTVPLAKRPVFAGLFGASKGICSVAGPPLGGALTEQLSWRWCFYINLPFGAVSMAAVAFLLDNYQPKDGKLSLKEKFAQLDILGMALLVPCMTGLILALESGGSTYAWSNWRIVILFVIFGLLLLAWLAVQAWKGDNGTVPPRIFFQRSVWASFLYSMMSTAALTVVVYYIPLWFQAVKGQSPVKAGISMLPTILSLVAAAILAGAFTQKVGYYWPAMIAAPIVASVGTGMLTTLKVDTGHPKWIAYQFLTGFGVGMGMQQTVLAVQAVLPGQDISTGMAIMLFGGQLGGAVFLAVAETIFLQQLTTALGRVPGADVDAIIKAGAADLDTTVPALVLSQTQSSYNGAITSTVYLAVGLVCVMLIPALFVERKSIKGKEKGTMGKGNVTSEDSSSGIEVEGKGSQMVSKL